MEIRDSFYIAGAWVPPAGAGAHEVRDSNTDEVIGRVPEGTVEDMERAVDAAADAFEGWAATPVDTRAKLLRRASEALDSRADALAATIAQEVGMPVDLARDNQVALGVGAMVDAADAVAELRWDEELANSLIVREPVGVVGAITPWNYPLFQIALKVAPALAVGCTVVLKPSEVAPLNAYAFADALDEAGFPPGVFNMVVGPGTVVGEVLATHPRVDMVSFTGSTRAGKRVMELAAQSVKRVALELGGKSANVVLDDADLERVVPRALLEVLLNSGQTCSALTRLLVPRSRLAEVEERVVAAVPGYRVGRSLDHGPTVGPLASRAQLERVRSYIRAGIDEGAKLLVGGPDAPEGLEDGYFVRPTVFSEVTNDMTIAREEIFGPVLSILPYDSEDDAVRIANDTPYGLSGAVWSADPERAERVARRLRTGQVTINGGRWNPKAPFGGYKQSGFGRERGPFGLEEYLEIKSMQR